MLKRDELTHTNSCLNKARDDEWIFVLLGRDAAAPVAVRAWVAERLRIGKNQPDDPQITEAVQWCERLETEAKGRCVMATNDETRAAAESVHWRCFHCDKTFTQSQHKQAREHFGTDEGKMPVCLMRVPGEDGLLAALRRAEANLAEWQEERHPLMMALVSQAADHAAALQREEEKGYARGLKDYTKVEAELARLRAEVAELVAAIQKYSVYAQARGSAPFGTTAEEQAALARHDAGKGGGE